MVVLIWAWLRCLFLKKKKTKFLKISGRTRVLTSFVFCSGCSTCKALSLVPQVVDIMRVNVDKVLERDQKLSELDDRADALQAGASQFETNAAKLKRKYWWKNCKVKVPKSKWP